MQLPAGRILLVTVTYGDRWAFLKEAVTSAIREGVDHCVIVDNSAANRISTLASEQFGSRVTVVPMGRNTGSAPAYKTGMETAARMGAEFVLLMDDDNALGLGTLPKMKSALEEAVGKSGLDRAISAGFRPAHEGNLLAGMAYGCLAHRHHGFMGIDLTSVPHTLRVRLDRLLRTPRQPAPGQVRISVECHPYSAILFHRSVFDRFGYPNAEFVVYADDTEFTHRIVGGGGTIIVDTTAIVNDLEVSWNKGCGTETSIGSLVVGGKLADFRAFYATRNRTYFEEHCRRHVGWLRALNRFVFFAMFGLTTLLSGDRDRYALIKRAIRCGERGELGEDPAFPLQG
jgi:GT2 family glycosyltransferase